MEEHKQGILLGIRVRDSPSVELRTEKKDVGMALVSMATIVFMTRWLLQSTGTVLWSKNRKQE